MLPEYYLRDYPPGGMGAAEVEVDDNDTPFWDAVGEATGALGDVVKVFKPDDDPDIVTPLVVGGAVVVGAIIIAIAFVGARKT